ncbi:MAG: S-layer homology domain-containing protein, partial [Clostridiales Family XIII bacterium]|nr:S-layer homology domain-containing protein [Clostridiales Family XIII bacterium]
MKLTLTTSAIILPSTPIDLKISGAAVTGTFYLKNDENTTGVAITTTTAAFAIPGPPVQVTASAIIGINSGKVLVAGEQVTVAAYAHGTAVLLAEKTFTVQDAYEGGYIGGGGGGGGTPAVPKTDDEKKGGSAGSWADNPFYDVKPTDWFYSDVEFVVKNGLFQGVSASSFSPGSPMTRGMIVTVLGRLYGADENAYANSSFSDVSAGQYYTAYVEWAKANGIVNGVGDNLFAPN